MVNIARAAVFTVALLLAVTVHARGEIPANDGWVTDLVGFLTPQQEATLETLMESYKQGSGQEIALLTVPIMLKIPTRQMTVNCCPFTSATLKQCRASLCSLSGSMMILQVENNQAMSLLIRYGKPLSQAK